MFLVPMATLTTLIGVFFFFNDMKEEDWLGSVRGQCEWVEHKKGQWGEDAQKHYIHVKC
jgi:hypothetical protein